MGALAGWLSGISGSGQPHRLDYVLETVPEWTKDLSVAPIRADGKDVLAM